MHVDSRGHHEAEHEARVCGTAPDIKGPPSGFVGMIDLGNAILPNPISIQSLASRKPLKIYLVVQKF